MTIPLSTRLARPVFANLGVPAIIAAAYIVTGSAGLLLDPVAGFAAYVWPPTGIAIGAAFLIGSRAAPAIYLGAFVVNLLAGASPLVAAIVAAGNLLEALGGAWMLRQLGLRRSLERFHDAYALLIAGAAAAAISATIGVTTLAVAGNVAQSQFALAWVAWWVGDAIGALLVTPIILLWIPERPRLSGRRWAELAGLVVALLVVSGFVFFSRPLEPTSLLQAYPVFPLLLVMTVRFQQRGSTLAVFLMSAVAIAGTARLTGPFSSPALGPSLLALQTFMGMVAATFLLLGAAMSERADARNALQLAENEESARRLAAAEMARLQAVKAERNARFLARATELLSASLNYEATLSRLAKLVVPELADWCVIDTRAENGGLRRLAVAHKDPERIAQARQLETQYPTDMNAATGIPQVFRTGVAEIYPDITDEMLAASARDADHLKITRELGLRSVMIVPIKARESVDGVLMLVSAESGRRFTNEDLELAKELGRRAGLAVENSLLMSEVQSSADRITRLQTVTSRLASVVNPDAIGDAVLEEGTLALGATHAALGIMTPENDALELLSSVGLPDEMVRSFKRFPLDAPLPMSEAVRTREGVFLENRAEVVRRFPTLREANERATTDAWIALPLMTGERPIGGIAFGFATSKRFNRHDRYFARALAHQAAMAIERTRLYAAERKARAEAETANRVKSEFLATMSHELRTPLNAIVGYAELLQMGVHGPLTGSQVEAIDRIQKGEKRLRGLIDDVLTFARIESNRMEVTLSSVNLSESISEVEQLVAPQLRGKRLGFHCECDSALMAHADREKVQQILLNLVVNSSKFTPEGGKITVSARRTGEVAEVRVTDTGVGVATDMLEQVFEPFVQAGRSLASPKEGSGLGLAISRNYARLMHGDLTVTSQVGKGSTFTLTLPAT